MPNIKSAKKRLKQSLVRRDRNCREAEEKEAQEEDRDRSSQYPTSSEMHLYKLSSIRFYPFGGVGG